VSEDETVQAPTPGDQPASETVKPQETKAPAVRPVEQIPVVGSQIDPTGDMKPIPPDELISNVGASVLDRWLEIFIQLCRSERFLKFVERNFVIQDRIDDEKKQVLTVIYENPKAVGPGLTKPQVAKIHSLLKTYSCRHPQRVLTEILNTLGQEDVKPSIIPSASASDVEEAVKQVDLKKEMD
jgi:hypothetical protein